ncbi:MAG: hypothetical protein KGJ19_05240, partial [Betaproteobacteria bacterium]|nr:hypothetical protein [Betaproteobacteria bacterium]
HNAATSVLLPASEVVPWIITVRVIISTPLKGVQIKLTVRPELVEGLWVSGWWFDKLTTNG